MNLIIKKHLVLFTICFSMFQVKGQNENSLLLLELNMEYQYLKMSIDNNDNLVYIHDNLGDMERLVKISKKRIGKTDFNKKTKKMILDYLESYSSIKPIQVLIGIKKDDVTVNQLNQILKVLRTSLLGIYQKTLNSDFIPELDILSGIYASGKKFYPLYVSSQELLAMNRGIINSLVSELNKKKPKLNKFVSVLNKKEVYSDKDLSKFLDFYLGDLRTEYISTITENLKD